MTSGEQIIAQSMYNLGYRYRIHIEVNGNLVPPLYIKIGDLGAIMRQSFPDGKITKVQHLNSDGTISEMNRGTPIE